MAYVSEYGNYGVEDVVTFGEDLLTPHQWHVLSEISDMDKFEYVQNILEGNDVSEWEEPYS